MSKKNSQYYDELYGTTEQVDGEPVDTDVNPDGITIDPSTGDSEQVTVEVETPVVENPETPVVETPTPVTVEQPVVEKPEAPADKEPTKLDEFKRFNIRFGYSIDSRSTTTRRTLSTTEIVKQFVKAPTCFIAFETEEDLNEFVAILKIKTVKIENKEGKLVDFSDVAKEQFIERVTELSEYWIARNSK
jgi:hypothetical protein